VNLQRKLTFLVLCIALLVTLIACGNLGEPANQAAPASDRPAPTGGDAPTGGATSEEKTSSKDAAPAPAAPAPRLAAADPAEPAPLDAPADAKAEAPAGDGAIGRAGKGGAEGGAAIPAAEAPSPAKADKATARGEGEERKREIVADELEPPAPPRQQAPQARQLTAGEWRDLDHWDFWRALFDGGQQQQAGPWQRMEPYWGFYTGQRIPVQVRALGNPVTNAHVVLRDKQQRVIWQARTDNLGRAQLFAGLFDQKTDGPFSIEASSGDAKAQIAEVTVKRNQEVTVELSSADAAPSGLDIMFTVDTTGSMGDELNYLKSELQDVIRRVLEKNGQQLSIHTSVNFYRDHGDEYVVRAFPFESDVALTQERLNAQSAGGGGDFPEAFEEAVADSVLKHQWRHQARARLLFVILDAPPHYKPEVMSSLHESAQEAARQGIQIIPIVGSGIDKPTEFLMRQLAATTNGTYIFLTDDSGIGGSHLKPTIGPHEVEHLNNLLVRVINRALEAR
jgi:Mg-chelatase subunit ChlD